MPRRLQFLLLAAALALAGCGRGRIERVEWTVMSTVAAVQTEGRDAAIAEDAAPVRESFAAVEKLLNAFDPESELSRLKGLPDDEVLAKCDASVRECYAAAFRLRDESGGVFNPRWKGGGTMDLGAIAKGFAVDLAAARLADGKGGRSLVDLGGNLKAVGGDWKIGIDGGGSFTLRDGEACATSGEYFRGKHIRDGRTGGEIAASVRSVTVVHPTSAMLADGLSTLLFILGPEKGAEFLEKHYPRARAYWQGEKG